MKHFEKIDGLRFLAIFFVLIEHFVPIIGGPISAGYFGVDLFFVISGFLITKILIRDNDLSFKENYFKFLGRRTVRIFPLYYTVLIILWLVNLPVVREKAIWFYTYTFNYAWIIYDIKHTPVVHFWSLSVEEQFYLFWPIIILAIRKNTKALIFVTITTVLFGYSQMYLEIFDSITKFKYVGILTRMASLSLGGLGAIIATRFTLPAKLFTSKVVEYGMYLLLILLLTDNFILKYPLLGICSCYFVLKASYFSFNFSPLENLLKNESVKKIGTISYGIYVFHLIIAFYFTKYVFDPIWLNIDFSILGPLKIIRWHAWIIKFPLFTILSIILADLSFRYYETPFLKLKDKYFKY